MKEQVSAIELRTALVSALQTLAPLDGEREIPAKAYADALLDLLVQLVFKYNTPPTLEDVDGLVAAFRGRIEGVLKLAEERRTNVKH